MTIARYGLIRLKPFRVLRTSAGDWVDGYWVDGEETEVEVQALWYNMKGYELAMRPEAFRSIATIKVQTIEPLNSIREADSTKPDKIYVDGYWYEIHERDKFSMGVRDHYEQVAVRLEQSAGG